MKIGVLALQGAFVEHIKMLEKMGISAIEVRKPQHLKEISGIILPGGESTTFGKLMIKYDLFNPLQEMGKNGFPMMGTCAGLIMLSKSIQGGIEKQPLLELMNIHTQRNAYGRQIDSFETALQIPALGETPFPGVFIRAPRIDQITNGVTVLARYQEQVIAVEEGNLLATTFHPELTHDHRIHHYFINKI